MRHFNLHELMTAIVVTQTHNKHGVDTISTVAKSAPPCRLGSKIRSELWKIVSIVDFKVINFLVCFRHHVANMILDRTRNLNTKERNGSSILTLNYHSLTWHFDSFSESLLLFILISVFKRVHVGCSVVLCRQACLVSISRNSSLPSLKSPSGS